MFAEHWLPPGRLVEPAPPVPPEPLLASGLLELVPEPQTPLVQAPLAHSLADAQLLPSGSIVPVPQKPLVHAPLAQSVFAVHWAPGGAPCPLPEHAPLVQTPLAQSPFFEQLLPPGPIPVLPLSDEPHE